MNSFPFPAQLLFGINEGRYAVSTDDSERFTFVRLSIVRPMKSGKKRAMQDSMKIQTQHGDDLVTRAYVWPGGAYYLFSNWTAQMLVKPLMLIMTDPWGAAMRYGQELGQCCRCGKSLTDERSRYYGIGPECEGRWPAIIGQVDEYKGSFVPSTGYAEAN